MNHSYHQLNWFDTPDPNHVPYPDAPSAVVVSISGGNDSVATAVWARRRWPASRIVLWHAFLTADWPQTDDVINDVAACIGNARRVTLQAVYELAGSTTLGGFQGTHLKRVQDVDRDGPAVAAPGEIFTLLDFARQARNGRPPTAKLRWCTDYFKRRLCNWWLQENRMQLGPSAVLLSGERRAESTGRCRLPTHAWRCCLQPSPGWPQGWRCLWARPLIDLRLHEVTRLVVEAGAPIHPAYFLQGETLAGMLDPQRDERGRARLSCVCCMFSHQQHITAALTNAPELVRPVVDELQAFEQETGYSWQQRGPLLPTR